MHEPFELDGVDPHDRRFLSISFSWTMSMAIFRDAAAVRFPTRVWSM